MGIQFKYQIKCLKILALLVLVSYMQIILSP